MPSTVKVNESLLDQRLAQLEKARAWSPRAVSRLEALIRSGDDFDLFRINPVRYARERDMPEAEAIDLFLHAVHVGLFEMDWQLICPDCGHVVDSLRGVGHLHSTYVCNSCSQPAEAALDDYILVSFSVAPHIRDIAYHHPESLAVEDFAFRYHTASGVVPLPDGTSWPVAQAFVTKLLSYLEPDEKKSVEIEAKPGILTASDLLHDAHFGLRIVQGQATQALRISLALAEGKFQTSDVAVKEEHVMYNPGVYMSDTVGEIPAGRLLVEVHNRMKTRAAIWVVVLTPELISKPKIAFEPHLSGKRLLTTQTFRDLFRHEVIKTDEGIGVRDITVMFTDLKGSTEMYDKVGDPKAYYLVRQHFEALGKVVAQYEGATIKTIGDAVMATFMTPLDGVRAALEMHAAIDDFNANISEKLSLKIGLHRGQSILVTLNDKLDYFGQTVNIAARVQGLSGPGEIYLTQAVFDYPGVQAALAEGTLVTPKQAALKGIGEKMQVYKVTAKS